MSSGQPSLIWLSAFFKYNFSKPLNLHLRFNPNFVLLSSSFLLILIVGLLSQNLAF